MRRLTGIIITLVWLGCMAALIQRDVLPYWQAQNPPTQQIPDGDYQVAITNAAGQKVGTTWVTTIRLAESTTIHSLTQLDVRKVSSMLPFAGDMYLTTDLTYGPAGGLNEFIFLMDSSAIQGRVQGVRYDKEFACKATVGAMTQTMTLDAELSKYIGDSMRPFTHLQGLHVGQTWRLRILDPFSMMRGGAADFTTKLVKVTGRETINHHGRMIACFRIESDGIIAWADESGRVLQQDVLIPLLGRWTITEEPFDDNAKRRAHSERQVFSNNRPKDKNGADAMGFNSP